MKKKILFIISFLLLVFSSRVQSQILINEVSSATDTAYIDEDGDQEDWVEFYNTTSSTINLQGYSITRRENNKDIAWTFPNSLVRPNSYFTVFCSGKNRNSWFDHWEVPVYAANTWKYLVPTAEPPAAWRTPGFNDAAWSSGPGGIGYGDGDDSTVIVPTASLYMRKTFVIPDTSKISIGALLIDYDDAFVAYLNDVEIARSNIGIYGDHPPYNALAYDEHEATLYQNGNFSGAAFIPENVMDSALVQGTNVFCIQTHNFSSGMDDLTNISYLLLGVKDASVTFFPFPAQVNLHTNFNLDAKGQTLTLKNPAGNIIDQQIIGEMQMNDSRGRKPDGSTTWCLMDLTSPDTTNNLSPCYNGYSAMPKFSLAAGFYNGTQTLSLTGSTTPGTIHYTVDGSVPTSTSPSFSTPISIDSTTIVRARSIEPVLNLLPGETATNTYFIDESTTLPVISLSSDPRNLFDYYYGIYELGPNADTVNLPFLGANFWQGWARPAHVEYFDKQEVQRFETNAEIKIQGSFSKAWAQKGFSVKPKDDYGGAPINYKLFPDKPITEYKSFNIRNAGSDWNTCHMRDRLQQKNIQKKTNLDMVDGKPCLLFINGKYWGVYEIREKQDKNYIENNSGADGDKIDFLQFDGDIIEGSNKGFLEMMNYITANNMAIAANYDSVKKLLDINNFCDYFITETYDINVDWLGAYTNNIKFWRQNNPPGKWRYVLWDTDVALGFIVAWGGSDTTNFLATAINPPTWNPHSGMLKALLQNPEFKNYFINRYADLMNTVFHPYNYKKKAYELHDELLPEMARHFNLWGGTSPWLPYIGSAYDIPTWEQKIDSMTMFMDNRPFHARNHIQKNFSMIKQVNVSLDAVPAGAGTIKISTIIPDSLPWTGVYFNGNPVTITATANSGYKFNYWKSNIMMTGENYAPSFTLDIDTNDTFRAYFEETENKFSVFPNPFSDNLTIKYELKDEAQPSLKIYSITGQVVAEILTSEKFQQMGTYTIEINPDKYTLRSGVYYVEFKTSDFYSMEKLVRIRK